MNKVILDFNNYLEKLREKIDNFILDNDINDINFGINRPDGEFKITIVNTAVELRFTKGGLFNGAFPNEDEFYIYEIETGNRIDNIIISKEFPKKVLNNNLDFCLIPKLTFIIDNCIVIFTDRNELFFYTDIRRIHEEVKNYIIDISLD